MIIITFEDFPDQVFPHLCCRDSSGQEKLLYEPSELCYETLHRLASGLPGADSKGHCKT